MKRKKILISDQPHQAAGLKPGPTAKETLENWLRECGGDPEGKKVKELREELEKVLPESVTIASYEELPKSIRIWLRELDREVTFIGAKQTPELRSLPVQITVEEKQIDKAKRRDPAGSSRTYRIWGAKIPEGSLTTTPARYLIGSLALFASLMWTISRTSRQQLKDNDQLIAQILALLPKGNSLNKSPITKGLMGFSLVLAWA